MQNLVYTNVYGCCPWLPVSTSEMWQVVGGGTFVATALRSPPAVTKDQLIICQTQQMLC